MLGEGAAIDELRERLGAVRKANEDLPRRLEAMNGARDTLSEAARRLGFPSYEELLAGLPTDVALARVQELIATGKRNVEKHREAAASCEAAARQHNLLKIDQDGVSKPIDPEPFRQRLDALADTPANADRFRREIAACESETRALVEAASALNPIAGSLDGLSVLPLPEAETIREHVRIADASIVEARDARTKLAAVDRAFKTTEATISNLSRAGAFATKDDLVTARARRETSFDYLQASLDGDLDERRLRFAAARSFSQTVDQVTDSLLTDTQRSGRRQAAEESLVEQRDEKHRCEMDLVELEKRGDLNEAGWRALWIASPIVPRSPAEMALWRERVAGILDRRSRLAERRVDIDVLAAAISASRTAALTLLKELGGEPNSALPPELLYREAKNRLDSLLSAWADAKARQVAEKRSEQDIVDATLALSKVNTAMAEHAKEWPEAISKIGLPATASLGEAEAAMSVWQSVPLPRQIFDREERSAKGIEKDLESFNSAVAAITAKAAPGLAAHSPQIALQQLTAALMEARRAADTRARLRNDLSKRRSNRVGLEARRKAASVGLADAYQALNVDGLQALESALDRLYARQALDKERSELARDLNDIADGLDETSLRGEQSKIDVDLAPGDIDRLGLRQSQLLIEMGNASAIQFQVGRDRDTLTRGRDAVGAVRERTEAAADLLSIAERWIVRAAAARLATRAIERHRAAAQDPLIARAGALFSLATARAFSGLGADYDDEDRPVLVARRAEGKPVNVDGLSEGTRDQLFLALRLALLEHRVAEPLPFIGDDLLASFDEKRTAGTLALLSEFSRNRQVILFTHHLHVAELAAAARDPAIEVIAM